MIPDGRDPGPVNRDDEQCRAEHFSDNLPGELQRGEVDVFLSSCAVHPVSVLV